MGIFLSSTSVLWAQRTAPKKQNELLSLGSLPIINKTGSPRYQYLSRNLSAAIDAQIKKAFAYRAANQARVNSRMKFILKREKKRPTQMNESHVRELAKRENVDILIYGEYRALSVSRKVINNILIRIGVYLRPQNETHWVEEVSSLGGPALTALTKDIAQDTAGQIDEFLIYEDGKKKFRVLFQTKKPRNKDINKKFSDEIENLKDHIDDERSPEAFSLNEFRSKYLAQKKDVRAVPDISSRGGLLTQLKKFKISNIIEAKADGQIFSVNVIVSGRQKRYRDYNLSASAQEKEKVWGSIARSLKAEESLLSKIKRRRQNLVRSRLKPWGIFSPQPPFLEAGLRVGYLHPIILGDTSQAQPESSGGYSIEAYYTQSLSIFYPELRNAYLPHLHVLTAFENYNIEEVNSVRVAFAAGFLYSLRILDDHSIQAGVLAGGNYESVSEAGAALTSGFLFSAYILLGYEYRLKRVRFSCFWRTILSPDKTYSLLGQGFSAGAGYPIEF